MNVSLHLLTVTSVHTEVSSMILISFLVVKVITPIFQFGISDPILGSMMFFSPTCGSYEANPPFVEEVMLPMTHHILNLLDKTEDSLSFVVIVPAWTDTIMYDLMSESKYLRRTIVLEPNQHVIFA